MSIILSIIDSPFSKELRFSCKKINTKTDKNGEIVILPNHQNMIFSISNTAINITDDTDKAHTINIIGNAICKIKDNNCVVFGQYSL